LRAVLGFDSGPCACKPIFRRDTCIPMFLLTTDKLWNQPRCLWCIHVHVYTYIYNRKYYSAKNKKEIMSWTQVAHTCNPNYSRGRDQDDCSSKSAQANSLWDPILKKKIITKMRWWSGSRCRPWDPGKWMELIIIVLREISQAQKAKYCMFSLICGN
jgi:hypothetical protein